MRQYTASDVETIVKDEVTLSLEALIRVGARRMLQAALDFEVEAYVAIFQINTTCMSGPMASISRCGWNRTGPVS